MATLREFLDKEDFDWDTGRIIIKETKQRVQTHEGNRRYITRDDPLLDVEFDSSYGSPECPSFVAEDKGYIYFPVVYDGATWADKICKDITKYIEPNKEHMPYPGCW